MGRVGQEVGFRLAMKSPFVAASQRRRLNTNPPIEDLLRAHFSQNQIKELNNLFPQHKINWDTTDKDDLIWFQCIEHLKDLCEKPTGPQFHQIIRPLSTKAMEILEGLPKGEIKQYFIDHVVTKIEEVDARRVQFASGLVKNRSRKYTCLIPNNPELIVHDHFAYFSGKHAIGEDLDSVNERLVSNLAEDHEIDLFFNKEMKDGSVPSYDLEQGQRHFGGGHRMGGGSGCRWCPTWHAIHQPVVVLPDGFEDNQAVARIGSIFEKRASEIYAVDSRKENFQCCIGMIAPIALIASYIFVNYH